MTYRKVAEVAQGIVEQPQRHADRRFPPQQVIEGAGCCRGPTFRRNEEESPELQSRRAAPLPRAPGRCGEGPPAAQCCKACSDAAGFKAPQGAEN